MSGSKSGAERQAAYRARHLRGDGEGARLNMVVSVQAKAQMERLAARYGVTQREVVERLLREAESTLLDAMSPIEQRRYWGD